MGGVRDHVLMALASLFFLGIGSIGFFFLSALWHGRSISSGMVRQGGILPGRDAGVLDWLIGLPAGLLFSALGVLGAAGLILTVLSGVARIAGHLMRR